MDSNQRLSTISIGIITAPIRQSEILKQTIRKLRVFFIHFFVAKKETTKAILETTKAISETTKAISVVMISGQ